MRVLCGTLCPLLTRLRHELEELGAGHLAQHAGRHGIRAAVVVDVDVQPIHHIEVRIGKQFFHGGIAHLGPHTTLHEGLEIGRGRQRLHIVECRQRCFCRYRPIGRRLGKVFLGRCGRYLASLRHSRRLIGRWGLNDLRWCRCPFLTRPAAEETFAHAPPSRCPPLRLPSVLMLTGWPNRSVKR